MPGIYNWKGVVEAWNDANSNNEVEDNFAMPNLGVENAALVKESKVGLPHDKFSNINESANFIDGFEVVDGDGLKHTCDSLQKFGLYQIFRIYDSDDITYCLMRRCDNGKYFYTTIVDAPELGKNETKFKPLSHKEVPRSIFLDSLSLIRQLKMERI